MKRGRCWQLSTIMAAWFLTCCPCRMAWASMPSLRGTHANLSDREFA